MGVRLEKAKQADEIHDMIYEIISAFHGDLATFEVTVGVVYAHADSEAANPKPPVTWLGVPAPAAIARTNYEKRVWGLPDAVLTIDAQEWGVRDREQREALVDSYLAYLQCERDKDGAVKTDDAMRPRLTVAAPDWLLAGHARVLERRGVAAVEAMAFRKALTDIPKLKQLLISFAAPGDTEYHGVETPSESAVHPFDYEGAVFNPDGRMTANANA